MLRILMIADIIGQPGRKAVGMVLPYLRKTEGIDFVIANGENAAGGVGLTGKVAEEIFNYGVDVLTLGNHTWQRKEINEIINDGRVIRPANYPPSTSGRGFNFFSIVNSKIMVANLLGRVHMLNLDCPFRTMDTILATTENMQVNLSIVDFHAEVTSEKQAFAWYLDGKVSAVVGTHTHVQTADERVLPEGTGYITDCGMTGARDSVIGVKKELVLKKYLTQLPVHYEVADKDVIFQSVILDIDEVKGKTLSLRRFTQDLGNI